MKYSPITLNRLEYKALIKMYKEPNLDTSFAEGYVRALYHYDFITKNQQNYLNKIINKYGSKA